MLLKLNWCLAKEHFLFYYIVMSLYLELIELDINV